MAALPAVVAGVYVASAIRAGVRPRRLAGLLAIATAAGAVYLVARSAIGKVVSPSRWFPFVFDVMFALGFAALLGWLDRCGLVP